MDTSRGAGVLAILLLAFMAVLSLGAALRESPTFDETAHIGAGLSYVQKLDLRLNPEHPPLSKALTGLALTMHGTYADYAGPAWSNSKDFVMAFMGEWSFGHWVIARWNKPADTLLWARLPMLLLTLLLGGAIFVFGKHLGGVSGGLICLAVFVSEPVFLTFGPLVLTDIPVTLFSVLAIWTFANLWRKPERRTVWIFALCLAGALLCKFSALIVILGLLVSGWTMRGRLSREERRLRWRATGKGLLLALLMVYGCYFVLSWHQPTSGLAQIGSSVPALVLRRLLLPPATYLGGMVLVLFNFSRPTFLLGHAYPHGVWFYYPVVFALKTPLGFIGLLLLTVLLGFRGKLKDAIPLAWQLHWRTIWVTLVVFVTVCVLSHFDISIRHFSVPLALLILLLAPLGRTKSYGIWGAIALLVTASLFTAVRAYPWYFPYVNPFGLGKPVYTLMSDSNIDWNQSLPEVERFAETHQIDDLPLDSYGLSDDTVYVPHSRAWDCQAPSGADAGRWVVVSANMILDGHNCSWLLGYPKEELAGGSMYAFHLPAAIPADGTTGGPPRLAERRMFLGIPFDYKAMTLQMLRKPETIPALLKEIQSKTQRH